MITLTDRAKEKVVSLLARNRRFSCIRISVKTTGCSGLAYVLEYVDSNKFDPLENNIVYPEFTIKVPVKAEPYLRGLVVDYVKNGLNEGFDFSNPNERGRCGCGESFRV